MYFKIAIFIATFLIAKLFLFEGRPADSWKEFKDSWTPGEVLFFVVLLLIGGVSLLLL